MDFNKHRTIAIIAMIAVMVSGCSQINTTPDGTETGTITETSVDEMAGETTLAESSVVTTVPQTVPVPEMITQSSESEAVSGGGLTETDEDVGGFMGAVQEETTIPVEIDEPEETTTITEVSNTGKQPLEVGAGQEIATTYAYTTLTDKEKQIYNEIKRAAFELAPTVDVESLGCTEDEWSKVFSIVYYQEPEIFWLDPYMILGEMHYKTTDIAEIESMKTEIDSALSPLVEGAAEKNTIIDRVRLIHDSLIKMNNFQKDGGASYSPTIYGGLVLNTPQCEGYAKTFTYVCNKVGIESMVITGNVGSGASHAWNKVKIDGDWYNIDLTNDDPILNTPNEKHIRYNYFLVPDAWIKDKTHFRENLSQMFNSIEFFDAPDANSADFNYFNYYDTVFDSYDAAKSEFLARLIKAVENKDAIVQIKVSSPEIYEQLNSVLVELKDEVKAETGVTFSRVAAVCDENQLIIGMSFEY